MDGIELHLGDASTVMRSKIPAASVDLIYLDPPFGNRQEWIGTAGRFSDRWSPSDLSHEGWRDLEVLQPGASAVFAACDNADRGYLGVIARLLIDCARVMKKTATIWLHHDDTMGAYLRVLGDLVFGPMMQLGTMIWKRAHSHSNRKVGFGRVHDTISCWLASRAAEMRLHRIGIIPGDPLAFDENGMPTDPMTIGGFFGTAPLNQRAGERVGYPTQKPVALIQEIVEAATLPGDLVLDPCCGSGSALVAARDLGRRAIGIDMSADAIATAAKRLVRVTHRQMTLFARAPA